MKHKTAITAMILLALLCLLCVPAGAVGKALRAGTGSGNIGSDVSLPIYIDEPADVAGVAFTITYDPAIFEFKGLEEVAPQVIKDPETFKKPDPNPNNEYYNPYPPFPNQTDPAPTPTGTGTLFYQFNDEKLNNNAVGRLLVAGASAQVLSTANSLTLFNAKFHVKGGSGAYPIQIVRTIITNAAAGYTMPTFLPVFVGLPAQNANDQGFYPTLTYPATLTAGSITVNASTYSISGTVTYASDPVTAGAGCPVVLKRQIAGGGYVIDAQTTAANNGTYSFTGRQAGTYKIFVESLNPGYFNVQTDAFSVSANVTGKNIILPAPVRLSGSATLNGQFIPGMKIKVMNGETITGIFPVNPDGSFQTPPLPPGSYQVWLIYGNCVSQLLTLNQLNAFNVTLKTIGDSISGLTPGTTAAITAGSPTAKLLKTVASSIANGSGEATYEIANLCPAPDYIVSSTAAGLPVLYFNGETDVTLADAVDISAGNATNIDFNYVPVTKGTISGTIVEGNPQAPVPGIDVYAFEVNNFALVQVTTNGSGDYSFTLAEGDYEIFVIKANGKIFYYGTPTTTQSEAEATKIHVSGGSVAPDKDIDLTECTNTLTGKVTYRRADGDPVADVLIEARSAVGNGSALSGQDGTYSIDGLCPANYTVTMNPLVNQYAVQTATVTVPVQGTQSATQNFIIDTGNVLSGKVKDAADNTGIANAMLYLLDQETGMRVNGRMYFSDDQGNYIIADIPNGIYVLVVSHPLYRTYREAALDITSDTDNKDVSMIKGARFHGTVIDGSAPGTPPLPQALIIVTTTGEVPVNALTNASGQYDIYGFDTLKTYTILAQKRGYERQVQTNKVPAAGAGTQVNFTLSHPGLKFNLGGTVTSNCEGNPPVVGANVLVSSVTAKYFASATTIAGGNYSFTDLPQAGDYRLVVIPGGNLRPVTETGLNFTSSPIDHDVSIPCGSTIIVNVSKPQGAGTVSVFLYTEANRFVAYNSTAGEDGKYRFVGLAAGNYKVLAVASGTTPKWYNGKSTISTADPVAAGAGEITITLTL